MKHKDVIRTGDKVIVVTPRVVERVGYPLSYYDAYELVEDDPRYEQMALILECTPVGLTGLWSKPRLNHRVDAKLRALLAYQILQEKQFGGYERKIFFRDLSSFERTMFAGGTNNLEVFGKRVVKTGTYRPPAGGYESYYGEYWYEPGGLEDVQTHVLIRTEIGEFVSTDVLKVIK